MKVFRDLCSRGPSFLAAGPTWEEGRAVILGAPLDQTSTFRGGSDRGPDAIRVVSQVLETYSLPLKRDLQDCSFFDAGNLILPFGNVRESLKRIEEGVEAIVHAGKFPLLLGGEHLVTLPSVKVLHRLYPELVLLHLDAHADLRETYLGEKMSHATVIRRILETGVQEVYQLGIRSATRDEEDLAKRLTRFYPFFVYKPLTKILPCLKGRPVYLTLDIDLFDPGFAPGTGTPEPAGLSPREFFRCLPMLGELDLVAFDLVEFSPLYDQGEVTAALAAKIVREVLLLSA